MTDLLPNIIQQLGPESMDRLRRYAESLGVPGAAGQAGVSAEDDDDDEVPELVENFEETANK